MMMSWSIILAWVGEGEVVASSLMPGANYVYVLRHPLQEQKSNVKEKKKKIDWRYSEK